MLHTHHREFFFVTPPTGSADDQRLLTPLGLLLGFFFFRPPLLLGRARASRFTEPPELALVRCLPRLPHRNRIGVRSAGGHLKPS